MARLARPPCTLTALVAAAFGSVLATGCWGSGEATATERLWVSSVPRTPKASTTAFLTTRTGDETYLGAFFTGSMFRGAHDVFEWRADGKQAATLKFLQDGKKAHVRLETCTPTRGFDHCLIVRGDPTGAERYQSRKRWVVRRPGKRAASPAAVVGALAELAADDETARVLLEGA